MNKLLLRRLLLAGDGTARALVRTRICAGALPANGKPTPVPKTAVAPDVHETLDVHGDLGAQRAFDLEAALDLAAKTIYVIITEVLSTNVGIDSRGGQDLAGTSVSDSVDVGESDLDALAARQIDTRNTSHGLSLTLLVLRIAAADDAHDATSADHLAVLTNGLDAATNLHCSVPL